MQNSLLACNLFVRASCGISSFRSRLMSLSLTSVFLPPAKSVVAGSTDAAATEAVHRELEFFRAELLRQKIVFEAELRRQREVFEDRLDHLTSQNKAREDEVKHLRNTVHALTVRLDTPSSARCQPATPRRESPARSVVTPAPAQPATMEPSRAASAPRTPREVAAPSSARRAPSPMRGASTVRPHLTVVSRATSLARQGSVSGAAWK